MLLNVKCEIVNYLHNNYKNNTLVKFYFSIY